MSRVGSRSKWKRDLTNRIAEAIWGEISDATYTQRIDGDSLVLVDGEFDLLDVARAVVKVINAPSPKPKLPKPPKQRSDYARIQHPVTEADWQLYFKSRELP